MNFHKNKNIPSKLFLFVILLLGALLRLYHLSTAPAGLNQDEAYAGYLSYSLLHYGFDTFGYHNPVYFIACGSGMNALESYLMMPFIAILGNVSLAIRLPKAISGIVAIAAIYGVGKRMFNERIGLWAAFFLAICPWHVMASRWGLESNLAPDFLIISLYLLLLSLENNKFFSLTGLFYGLSLYCYATIWVLVPVFLLFTFVYLFAVRKVTINRHLVTGAIILFILALPLLLFLAINYGFINEITTPWFSIPKLVASRSGEFSLSNVPQNIKDILYILTHHSDSCPWNTIPPYGLFFGPLVWLSVVGFIYSIVVTIKSIKSREFTAAPLLLIWFLFACMMAITIEPNVNRMNYTWMPVVLFMGIAFGIVPLKALRAIICAILLVLSVRFENYYFTTYNEQIGNYFAWGASEAVQFAREATDDTLYLGSDISYSVALYSLGYPADTYVNTVSYTNYPNIYLGVASVEGIRFGVTQYIKNGIYVINANAIPDDITSYNELGSFGNYVVLEVEQ